MSIHRSIVIRACLAIAPSICAGNAIAISGDTTGATTLRRLADARNQSLGQAVGAMEGDISNIVVNPATAGSIRETQLSSTWQRGFADDTLSGLSIAYPSSYGTFDGSFHYYSAGNLDLLFADGTTHSVNAQTDYVVDAGYAIELIRGLSLGGSVKFFSSRIADESTAQTAAVDIGALKNLNSTLTAGVYATNLGGQLKYQDHGDPLPASIGIALSQNMFKGKEFETVVGLAGSYEPNEQAYGVRFGTELTWNRIIAFRIGVKQDAVGLRDAQPLSFGLGIYWGSLRFDYALLPASDAGGTSNIFTLSYRFAEKD